MCRCLRIYEISRGHARGEVGTNVDWTYDNSPSSDCSSDLEPASKTNIATVIDFKRSMFGMNHPLKAMLEDG